MSQKVLKDKHKEFSSQLDTLYNLSKVDGDVKIIIVSPNKDKLYEPVSKKQKLDNPKNKNEETVLDDSKVCCMKANSLILRSSSPVFYGMLSCEMIETQQKEIKIEADSEKDVDDLLYFMCTNSLRENANAHNIIHLAHYYQMDRLLNVCMTRLKENVTIDNFIATVKIFDYFEIDDGYDMLVKFGALYMKQLKKLKNFDKLSHAFKHSLKTKSNKYDNFIHFQIKNPPPQGHKLFKIKMRMDQRFGTIVGPLAQKFSKTSLQLSYKGKTIFVDDTPQTLIVQGISDNDLIDTTYT